MPVTMNEIDALRERSQKVRAGIHRCRYSGATGLGRCSACDAARDEIRTLQAMIEEKLRVWWAQGCREWWVAPPMFPGKISGFGGQPHVDRLAVDLADARKRLADLREVIATEVGVEPVPRWPFGKRLLSIIDGADVKTYADAQSKDPHPVNHRQSIRMRTCTDCGLIFDPTMISAHVIYCPARKS